MSIIDNFFEDWVNSIDADYDPEYEARLMKQKEKHHEKPDNDSLTV